MSNDKQQAAIVQVPSEWFKPGAIIPFTLENFGLAIQALQASAIVPQVVQAPKNDSVASMLRQHAYEIREHDPDCDVAKNMIAAATIIEIFDRQRAAPIVAAVPSETIAKAWYATGQDIRGGSLQSFLDALESVAPADKGNAPAEEKS